MKLQTFLILFAIIISTAASAQTASSDFVKVSIGRIPEGVSETWDAGSEVKENDSVDPDELAQDIPINKNRHPNRFALIIGNENYGAYGMGPGDVEYARNDANIFKEYAIATLGVPESNIIFRTNITSGAMNGIVERQRLILKNAPEKPELIFFYAGHGYPSGNPAESCLLPVDADPLLPGGAILLREILEKFTGVEGASVIAFTDACFTGEGRIGPVLMAQRGIKYVPVKNVIPENALLFAASQNDQPAFPFPSKKHGLFTFCLLSEIKQSTAAVTWGDLFEKVTRRVAFESVRQGYREQRPSVKAGQLWTNKWKQLPVKK